MKWVLLLVLVVGAALAEEQQQAVEEKEEGRFLRKGVRQIDKDQYRRYMGYKRY